MLCQPTLLVPLVVGICVEYGALAGHGGESLDLNDIDTADENLTRPDISSSARMSERSMDACMEGMTCW